MTGAVEERAVVRDPVAAAPAARYGAGKRTREGLEERLRSMIAPEERTGVVREEGDPAEGFRAESLPVLPVPEGGREVDRGLPGEEGMERDPYMLDPGEWVAAPRLLEPVLRGAAVERGAEPLDVDREAPLEPWIEPRDEEERDEELRAEVPREEPRECWIELREEERDEELRAEEPREEPRERWTEPREEERDEELRAEEPRELLWGDSGAIEIAPRSAPRLGEPGRGLGRWAATGPAARVRTAAIKRAGGVVLRMVYPWASGAAFGGRTRDSLADRSPRRK